MPDQHEIEDVKVLVEREMSLLCEIDGEEIWIPQSHITADSEVFDGNENSEGTLIITAWLARKKGLI